MYSRSCVSRSFDISTGICAGQKYGISVCQFGDFEPPKLQTFENKIVKVSSFSESNCTDPVDAACKSYFSESKVKLSPFLFLESVGLKIIFSRFAPIRLALILDSAIVILHSQKFLVLMFRLS